MMPGERGPDPTGADGDDRPGGLLGSFDNALAGVDQHDAVTPPTGTATTRTDVGHARPEPPSLDPNASLDPTASPWAATEHPGGPPRRPIDPDARRVAERLLHGSSPGSPRFRLVAADGSAATSFDRAIAIGRGVGDGDASTEQFLSDLAVVSRRHCDIRHDGNGPVISDAGSANGTFLLRGGDTIEVSTDPVPLRHGDLIATARGERTFARFEACDEGRP